MSEEDNEDKFNANHRINVYAGGPEHDIAPNKIGKDTWFDRVSEKTREDLQDSSTISHLAQKQDAWFCSIPFNQIYVEMNGNYQACCFGADSKISVEDMTLKEWMIDSKYMNDVRTEMLDPNSDLKAVEKSCFRCREDEKKYGRSRRTNCMKIQTNTPDHWDGISRVAEIFRASGGLFDIDERIFELQLKVWGSQCNLDCYMCHHVNSTTRMNSAFKHDLWNDNIWKKKSIIAADVKNAIKDRVKPNNIVEQCIELAPYTRSIKLIGGEPLIMKKQYEMLDKIIETGHSKEIIIKYQTNFTKMQAGKHRFIDYVKHFKEVRMVGSVDGIGKVNDYMRRKSSWEEIENNIQMLQDFDNVFVDFNGLVSILSVMRFYEVPDYVAGNSMITALNWSMLEWPRHLQPCNLPQPIKDKLIPIYKEKKWPDIVASLERDPIPDCDLQDVFDYLLRQDELYKGTKWEMNLFDVFPELEEFYVHRNTIPPETEAKFELWDKELEEATSGTL